MAAPNLASLTNITIDEAAGSPTTGALQDFIAAIASGKAMRIDAIFVCNMHASSIASKITIVSKKGGTEKYLAYKQRVGPGQTVNILLGKHHNLAEGDSIRYTAENASAFDVHAPYTLFT